MRFAIVTPPVEQVMLTFTRVVVGVGIRCMLYTMAQPYTDTFTWAGDPNGNSASGWGNDYVSGAGRPWASSYA